MQLKPFNSLKVMVVPRLTCEHRKASGSISTSINMDVNLITQDYGEFLRDFPHCKSVETTSNLETKD